MFTLTKRQVYREDMMWLSVVFLLMLGHLCLSSTVPSKCCMMTQWEAIMRTVDVTIPPQYPHAIRPGRKYMSMDQDNKRFAVTSHYAEGTSKFIVDVNNKKVYNIQGENCTVSPISLNMVPRCIPADALYRGSSYMGGGNTTIPFDSWNYLIAGWNANITISVSTGGCIPLAEEVLTVTTDSTQSMTAVFTSFTPGIKNPNVFVPPPGCQPQHKQEAAHNALKVIHQANRT